MNSTPNIVTIYAVDLTDGYKLDHKSAYPKNLKKIKSNFTNRKSRIPGVSKVVEFGLKYAMIDVLIHEYNEWFALPEDFAIADYMELLNAYMPGNKITPDHIRALHKLGYVPVEIKALPEGSLVPIKVPSFTIENTHEDFAWMPNFLETVLSCECWPTSTSATTAFLYNKIFTKYALETVGNDDFVKFQGHDFSFRGMFGRHAAFMSGGAHLTSFYGTDTYPALKWLKKYYGADYTKYSVGHSVTATEHSVMCVGTGVYIYDEFNGDWSYQGEAEYELFKRLITETYPTGILSLVSDTWSLPKVVTKILPRLKKEIMERDGKLVIRPDSFWTNPADCLCGFADENDRMKDMDADEVQSVRDGLVEALYKIFGGTKTERGYILLDSHIGTIYGDSITVTLSEVICERLKKKGFASINWVAGIGSYTYQYTTRDVFGSAMKATFAQVVSSRTNKLLDIEIFKDPITDSGMKKSARGRLYVGIDANGEYYLEDQVTEEREAQSELKTVFKDSKLYNEEDWLTITDRVRKNVYKELGIKKAEANGVLVV